MTIHNYKFGKIKQALFCTVLCLIGSANPVQAKGWFTPAVPTNIEVARGQGFFVTGPFGNPTNGGAACDVTDAFWVAITHPQYELLYSTVVTALVSGKQIKGYAHECTAPGWHGGTYNEVNGAGSLYLFQ